MPTTANCGKYRAPDHLLDYQLREWKRPTYARKGSEHMWATGNKNKGVPCGTPSRLSERVLRTEQQDAFGRLFSDWAVEELIVLEVNLEEGGTRLDGALDEGFGERILNVLL